MAGRRMTELPDPHFQKLQKRILDTISAEAREKYDSYSSWLYGAIGDPEADVMFVCENPPAGNIVQGHRNSQRLGIEGQWRGSRPERFRRALRETELLLGDDQWPCWRCYVTNVVKELRPSKEWKKTKKRRSGWWPIVRRWSETLQWELSEVRPGIVICVGGKSDEYVRELMRNGLDLGSARLCEKPIWHYSTPRGKKVVDKMVEGIRKCLGGWQ